MKPVSILLICPILLYGVAFTLGLPYAAFTDFTVTKEVIEKFLSLSPIVVASGFAVLIIES